MGLHKPFDRPFYVLNGATMTSGGSLLLAKGQFGVFDANPAKQDENGLAAVSSFAGVPKDSRYYIKVGISDIPVTRSQSDKSQSTYPFRLSDIQALEVSIPQITEQVVDEVILGYNGVDDSTAITLTQADRRVITLELSGEAIGLMGYEGNKVYIDQFIDPEKCYGTNPCVNCDNCTTVEPFGPVMNVIEQFKEHKLRGNRSITDFVEITPIKECTNEPTRTLTPMTFRCLEVCDTGDDNALAIVASQTPGYKVTRTGRDGATSKYQILADQAAVIPDFTQSIKSLLKGCEDCPAGYTEVTGGLLYAVTLEDDGADQSATVQGLPNAAAGTAAKQSQQDGVGMYTVVLTSALSMTDFNAFVAANPTATVKEVGSVADICNNATTTNISWTVCGTCNVSSDTYQITIPDDCNGSVLADLQQFYSGLTISEVTDPTKTEATVTLTGTSGTATLTIGANNYTVTFNTDLATTASDFITAEAANILANDGLTATSNGAVITLASDNIAAGTAGISIANATGDLDGTVVDVAPVVAGGCQRKYQTTVVTNLVCDECDEIFKDVYVSEAPGDYLGRSWELTSPVNTDYTGCKMGIRFKGKVFNVFADDCVKDEIGFIDSSVNIRVSGGHLTEVREGIGATEDQPFNVEYLSRWTPRTHMGGNLYQGEDEGQMYFRGEPLSKNDNVRKLFKGDSSVIIPDVQYADYLLTVRRDIYSQSFGQRHEDNITYHVRVELGRHQDVETLLNGLASAAGVATVKATA